MPRTKTGRPTNEENPRVKFDQEPPAGEIFLGDREVWVEGSVVIYEEDDEMLALRNTIREQLRLLSTCRRDEALNLLEGALTLRERVVPRDALGRRPRLYARRRGWDGRMSSETFYYVLQDFPGRTLRELAVELFPDAEGDPRLREPSLRVTLYRLRQRGKVVVKADPDGSKRYYPVVDPYVSAVNQQHQLLDAMVSTYFETKPGKHHMFVTQLMELIAYNRDRPIEAWRDPRGVIKTAIERAPAFEGAVGDDEDPF